MNRDGIKTTEFWLSTLTALTVNILSLLMTYQILNSEEASAWMRVIGTMLPLAAIVISGWIAKNYTDNRTILKVQEKESELETLRLEKR